jgi:CBS domain-containing protein
MLKYKAIEIFTSEEATCGNRSLPEAVIAYIRDLKIAARCTVTRGIAGCYESGEIATSRMEILSFNMPIRIYILLPEAQLETALKGLDAMITEGIVILHDLNVVSYRAQKAFLPRGLRVRDVMTPNPRRVFRESPLSEAARLLLSSVFSGLPVVDSKGRPVGVITQGDLIQKGGMPLRLGLLAESDNHRLEAVFKKLAEKTAGDVMTTPAVTVREGQMLSEAVDLMLSNSLKRLPVVDDSGHLTGMLSRLDVFRTVMRETPDWKTFRAQNIQVDYLKKVGDVLRRDTHTVSPDTSLEEVIRTIDRNDIQRVAVVDAEGKLAGLISDRDLLSYFKPEHEGIWGVFSKVKKALKPETIPTSFQKHLAETKAGAIMNTHLTTVDEDMLLEDAMAIMTEKALKRLPVVDKNGRFKGMISRDSLLRTGFGETA